MGPLLGFLNNPFFIFVILDPLGFSKTLLRAPLGPLKDPISLISDVLCSLSKYRSNETITKFFEQSIINFHDFGSFGALLNLFGVPWGPSRGPTVHISKVLCSPSKYLSNETTFSYF